jgi:hypothetical protein
MNVNWLLLLLIVLAFALARLAVTGRYQQVWGALSSIPLTPAQAASQTQASSSSVASLNRIG